MKLENVLYALFLLPLFGIALWSGVHDTKSFYNWYTWYSDGAEPIVLEGVIIDISPPTRRGPNQHRIVFKTDNGDKVTVRSKIPNSLFSYLSHFAPTRTGGRLTAMYTIGISGGNQMFKLASGDNVFFEKPTNYGNKPEQVMVAIVICLIWFGMAAIFLRMIVKEFTDTDK